MEQNRRSTPGGQEPNQLSETIATAIISASDEIATTEKWVPRRRPDIVMAIPRLMTIIMASRRKFAPDSRSGKLIRQSSIRVLAYLPADLRISCFLDLAMRNPMALDDLLSGEIAPNFEVYRYNLLSSLGIFARHGLIEEVFTKERVKSVGGIVDRSKKVARGE